MVRHNNKLRICLVASAGGHLTQLLKLSDGWRDYEAIYVSSAKAVAEELRTFGRTYIVGECNRQHPIKSLAVLGRCLAVVLKERPDVVISTGAMPGCLLCMIARIFGARIVWIDSIANVERLSLSGRLIRPFSSLFLTQWPELEDSSRNIEYAGAVI